jgi:DNA topoisomerase-3
MHTIAPKGSTVNLKDFKTDSGTWRLLRFDENFKLKLEPKKIAAPTHQKKTKPRQNPYPALNVKGIVIKGNTAYGCSHYKTGCDFNF